MFALLVRQRFLVWRNTLAGGPHPAGRLAMLAASVTVGLLFLGVVAMNTEALVRPLARQDVALAWAALPPLLSGFAIVALITALGSPLHHLYLGSDLDLLLAAPISRRAIFLLKLMEVWRDAAFSLILGLAVAIGYGRALAMPWPFFLLAALIVGGLTLTAAALGVSAVLLLVRVAPPGRVLVVVRLLSLVVVLPAVLLVPLLGGGRRLAGGLGGQRDQGAAFASFVRGAGAPPGWVPTTWAADALGAHFGQPWMAVDVALLAAVAAAVVGIAFALFVYGFAEGWDRARQVAAGSRRGPRPNRLGTLLGPVSSSSIHAIVQKDWRMLPRDPRWLMGLLSGLAVVAVSVFTLTLGGPRSTVGVSGELQFWLALLSVAYLTLTLGSQQGAGAFGYEGRNIALLRAAPVPTRAIVLGKMLAGFVPCLAVAWLVTLGIGVWLHGSPAEVEVAMAMAGWLMAGSVASSVGVAALTGTFAADNPGRSLGWLGFAATLALDGFFFTASVGLFAAGLLQSRAALPMPFAGVAPLVDAVLVALVAASVAAIVLVGVLGGRRLATWEGG